MLLSIWARWVLTTALAGQPYPASLLDQLNVLLQQHSEQPQDPRVLCDLASVYLDLGSDYFTDKELQLGAFDEGRRNAEQAFGIDGNNADAHFYYAANLGQAAHLRNVLFSALQIRDIKKHVERALELRPYHARTVHFLGKLLEELPWILGGDKERALMLLQRAVVLDPSHSEAHLHLAQAYLRRQLLSEAKEELLRILSLDVRLNNYAWEKRHQPEATHLLQRHFPEVFTKAAN